MNLFAISVLRQMAMLFALLASSIVLAQDKTTTADTVTYAGRWDFTNTQNGKTFGGEMKVALLERLSSSESDVEAFKGKLSFDGRQTNDKCGTFSGFGSDKPVDLLWEQKSDDVVLTYKLPCPIKDPVTQTRRFKLQGKSLVREYALPWGKGVEQLSRQ
jgi:hypothetical protein